MTRARGYFGVCALAAASVVMAFLADSTQLFQILLLTTWGVLGIVGGILVATGLAFVSSADRIRGQILQRVPQSCHEEIKSNFRRAIAELKENSILLFSIVGGAMILAGWSAIDIPGLRFPTYTLAHYQFTKLTAICAGLSAAQFLALFVAWDSFRAIFRLQQIADAASELTNNEVPDAAKDEGSGPTP